MIFVFIFGITLGGTGASIIFLVAHRHEHQLRDFETTLDPDEQQRQHAWDQHVSSMIRERPAVVIAQISPSWATQPSVQMSTTRTNKGRLRVVSPQDTS